MFLTRASREPTTSEQRRNKATYVITQAASPTFAGSYPDIDGAAHHAFAHSEAAEPAPVARLAAPPRRGRGAPGPPPLRYDRLSANPFDDGWDTLAAEYGDLPPLPTTLIRDTTRSAISWNTSPDLGFDRSVNPYRGCEHGCVYCYARPTHAYLGYSPGLEFETKLVFKPEVASLLEKELRRPSYTVRPMALGTNTDPYQPVDRTLKLTRAVLEVLSRYNHPVTIVTKSAGVLRDLDILAPMAAKNLARVYLSVTTLDTRLARRMEPRAATPDRRLAAIAALAKAGIPAGVLAAPMIPGLNDAELEAILARAKQAGATQAGYVLLRLPLELRQIFEDWLQTHYPDRARHVLSLVRQTRAGQLNDATFHDRFTGQGAYADLLAQRFRRAAQSFPGLTPLDTTQFARPTGPNASAQMSLAV
jgi:DNA repair photolyase